MNVPENWEQVFHMIDHAQSLDELKRIHETLIPFLKQQTISVEETERIYSFLNRAHRGMMKKALELAENRVLQENAGKRPDKISWMIMGSGARCEQTVWTDQDNGIVYSCENHERDDCERFVERFSEIGVEYFRKIGYPLCPGNVMATNPRWRQSIEEWKITLLEYSSGTTFNSMKFLFIAIDMAPIYGNVELVHHLREWLILNVKTRKSILFQLKDAILSHEVPINLFGKVFTERWGEYSGQFDIKTGVFSQFVNAIKFLAASSGYQETSTLSRMERLFKDGKLTTPMYEALKDAFTFLLFLRVKNSLAEKGDSHSLDQHIFLNRLSADSLKRLKQAMKITKRLQSGIYKRGDGD
ncbi:DUF294 nucleotidyltransferase-like domain-containing protein [Fictibacillus sp. Mic-4]|uniref:DUF294 nucleotidyltransferase-like domain-containing protein n=1 Tax=Fictibacillus sp. Mic-4 TaxID=3132826 RepID=UPI003CEE5F7C